ncbi:MAG: ASPIC/UnbV domain-containing protein, partial [Planctomycetes bacterium]|nr:ASPIC/UnbV domain-containing protein [Planctomycetota bacterium]
LVTVKAGESVLQRPVLSSSSFACASDASVHFGLGKHRQVDSISVRWSDGSLESFTADGVDRLLVLSKGEGARKN